MTTNKDDEAIKRFLAAALWSKVAAKAVVRGRARAGRLKAYG